MNYERTRKPGTGALFRNDRKANTSQPDYRGPYHDEVGGVVVEREIAAWIKKDRNSREYLSLKVSDKFVPSRVGPPLEPPKRDDDPAFDQDIPFD